MLKTRNSILVLLLALFVLTAFGTAGAATIDGLTSGATTAVYVNPGGVGDTLIYNYYNTNSGMQTFFTVTNTDSTFGQRVRVRFREAADIAKNGLCTPEEPRGSFEVLDFDICLSKNDMWSGVVTAAPGGGAMICSDDVDTSVYDGSVSYASFNDIPATTVPAGCVPFKFGADNLISTITAADTREGYFEMIGERSISAEPISCLPADDGTIGDATNSLFGNVAMIDGNTSATFTYDAAALADFAAGDIFQSPTTSDPTLGASDDLLNGVNFVLTKKNLYSIYDLIDARTEFVITAPTKALTQEQAGCGNDSIFTDDRVQFTAWNDAEQSHTSTCQFSPCPSGSDNELPFEVNVLQINIGDSISNILDSAVDQPIASSYDFGWFDVNLNKATTALVPAHTTTVAGATANGWPVLGLMLLDIDNGASTGAFKMQYTSDVSGL